MPQKRVEEPFDSDALVLGIRDYIARVASKSGSRAINPPHRVKFHWPPHPVSYEYHVLASDWTGRTTFEAHGETFDVEVARTHFGVFGRCPSLWHEARAESEPEMLKELKMAAEPLFKRQFAIAKALEHESRYSGEIRQLAPLDILKLFYCEDRDVANAAHEFVEVSHYRTCYFPALCAILEDRKHPWRRSAQWCVLDLFEDLPAYIDSDQDNDRAVSVMKGLLWDAQDDYARSIYKAGVVLGGHLPHRRGGQSLLDCLSAPSLVGRRAAIHGLFHVCEWVPEMEPRVVQALREHAKRETDPQLSIFAFAMAEDIVKGGLDHTPEPVFAFES